MSADFFTLKHMSKTVYWGGLGWERGSANAPPAVDKRTSHFYS